ncbi:MAG: helix-turn-helix transcriptional regulator [Alphaproteobacteria bacterium]|nr:helix-turn-helix transcriptional regulator [Alphaproteobacteria bacterium]
MPKKQTKLRLLLAKNLRELRERKGLSQEKLADKAKIHRTYVGSIERCEYAATIDTLEKIAGVLDVEPHALIGPLR